VVGASCDATQPGPDCAVGRGGNAVRYTLKGGTGTCAAKQAEIVGVQKYTDPDTGASRVVMQPHELFALNDPDSNHTPFSSGALTATMPDAQHLCQAPQLSVAQRAGGGKDVRYAWSNVKFYVSPAIPGTQWTAELAYTDGTCSATYEAVGVYPAISCQVQDADGNPVFQNGKRVLDASLCGQPDPYLLYALNPDFPVGCDADSGLCLLQGKPPASIAGRK